MAKHQSQVDEQSEQQYMFLVDCDYTPPGRSTHYANGTIEILSDWLAPHISSAIAAGIIKPLGGIDGKNSSA